MKTKLAALLVSVVLTTFAFKAFAIEGLTLSIQSSNVVLTWPSAEGETYIVQYRATLDPNDNWQTLANSYPAAIGTNWTTFIHFNTVCWPSGSGGGESVTNSPPIPNSLSSSSNSSEGESLLPMPPSPWDSSTWSSSAAIAQISENLNSEENSVSSINSVTAGVNSCNPIQTSSNVCSGFYRIFVPTPLTHLDIFGIEQGSISNQLDVLANDSDPDGNLILLSTVQGASHGEIDYSDDASIFVYTPTNTFSGVDTFVYSITNDLGGSNSAFVFVFVNETGNTHPSAPPLEFTLMTNQTVLSFPILTNSTDPDSDALQLVVIESPSRGIAQTNESGELIYTRTSPYLAQDRFSYILTDGHGGFAKRAVTINPQDYDGDGIPDEWEQQHGLDSTVNDASDDFDEDGLPNLAEYKLDTCPWVADNPLNLNNIVTGQTFRETAMIPVPLKSYLDRQPISFLINGSRANATLIKRADDCWYINWDSGYLTNGPYSIALEFQYHPNAQWGDLSFVGSSRSVVITNDVIFKQLTSEFSDYLVFDVTLATQTNYWRIELFDEQSEYIGYFYGSTTNGQISGAWDLTDGNGNQLASSHIRADFYVSPNGSTPPGGTDRKANRWFIKQLPGGIGNQFVVAWGWDVNSLYLQNQRRGTMLDGVVNIIGDPTRNDEYQLAPGRNIPYADAFEYHYSNQKDQLMAALKDSSSGNFFWFGHGGPGEISGDTRVSAIASGDVESVLQNKKHRSSPKLAFGNRHPYRLVILNGCETYSADWANAFGIDFSPDGTTNDVYAYYQQGRQSQAFVGWKDTLQVPGAINPSCIHSEYAVGLSALFSRWMDGYSLETCLTWYAYYMNNYSFSGHDSWRISGAASMWRTAP